MGTKTHDRGQRTILLATMLGIAATSARGQALCDSRVAVQNLAQYDLLEVRMHTTPDYLDEPNLLEAPLTQTASISMNTSGAYYVTVFRERNRGGRLIALTTQEPVQIDRGRSYMFSVFDESFRLEDVTEKTGFVCPVDDAGCSCVVRKSN